MDIGIDAGSRYVERKVSDGCSSVWSDALHRWQFLKTMRKYAIVALNDRFCRIAKTHGTTVISDALPSEDDILIPGHCKSFERREPFKETSENDLHP